MNCQINHTSDTQTRNLRRPAYNIDENENSYSVEVFIPGASKDSVRISLEDDTLTVQASRKQAQHQESWKALRREIVDADYRLQIQVNVPINREQISAHMEDGVLELTLPKAEEAKPKSIPVN